LRVSLIFLGQVFIKPNRLGQGCIVAILSGQLILLVRHKLEPLKGQRQAGRSHPPVRREVKLTPRGFKGGGNRRVLMITAQGKELPSSCPQMGIGFLLALYESPFSLSPLHPGQHPPRRICPLAILCRTLFPRLASSGSNTPKTLKRGCFKVLATGGFVLFRFRRDEQSRLSLCFSLWFFRGVSKPRRSPF